MYIIKELGSFPKIPPQLCSNIPNSTKRLIQLVHLISLHILPTKVFQIATRILQILTTWITLKFFIFHHGNKMHLNHQVIWLPSKELNATLRKCNKSSQPYISIDIIRCNHVEVYFLGPLLYQESNSLYELPSIIIRNSTNLQNIHCDTRLSSSSHFKNPYESKIHMKPIKLISNVFHIYTLTASASRHHASTTWLSIHTAAN
jgi:hypothetical protein